MGLLGCDGPLLSKKIRAQNRAKNRDHQYSHRPPLVAGTRRRLSLADARRKCVRYRCASQPRAAATGLAASASAAALSVTSQVKVSSVRPKCPNEAVLR